MGKEIKSKTKLFVDLLSRDICIIVILALNRETHMHITEVCDSKFIFILIKSG